MPPSKDLTGKRFGHWKVLARCGVNAGGKVLWECRCKCKTVHARTGSDLTSGHSTQCKACANRVKSLARTKHGMTRTREFVAWFGMLNRCSNPNHKSYAYYGGRGITVCERWLEFANFYADMGERPAGTSLDRIDNNGPYSPGNCTWSDRKTQMRNTRSNRRITFQGRTKTLAEWAEIRGLSLRLVSARIGYGWSVEDALTRPKRR